MISSDRVPFHEPASFSPVSIHFWWPEMPRNDDTSKRFKPGLHEVDGTYFVFQLSQPFRYGIG